MKKVTLSTILCTALLGASTLSFNSCGSLGGTSTTNNPTASILGGLLTNGSSSSSTTAVATNVVGSLLSSLLSGSTTLSQDALVGTWNYQAPDCVFESENLLMKAGGEVAATKVESELSTALAKVGVKKGSCSFTFNSDNTYSAVIGGKTISGNYTLDAKNKTIKMTYLAGLGSMTPHVALSGGKLSLLYESDKLLSLLSTVSKLSSNSAISTLSSLAGSYDGMYIGMQLTK